MQAYDVIKRRLETRASMALLAAASLGVFTTGTAYAAWAVSGTGNATTTSATISSLVVTPSFTGSLYPGASLPLTVTVKNPNAFPVVVTSIGLGTVTSGDPVNCPASNVTVLTTPSVTSLSIAAGQTATSSSIASAVTMLTTAPAACAGVTFTIAATASGTSA